MTYYAVRVGISPMEDDLQIAAGLRRIERRAAEPDYARLNGRRRVRMAPD